MNRLTAEELRTFLVHNWGGLGGVVFATWQDFNRRFFADALAPWPILIDGPSPQWRGETRYNARGACIVLHMPSDPANLLHEMLHAFLVQRGEAPGHTDAPWRREIGRISQQLGTPINGLPLEALECWPRSVLDLPRVFGWDLADVRLAESDGSDRGASAQAR